MTDIERVVAAAWCDVLDCAAAEPADDFFARGGDSFRVVRMLNRIRLELGAVIDPAVVFESPTFGRLCAAVKVALAEPATAVPLITTMHADGGRPPLVGVHGGFGNGSVYYPLARHLGADQPLLAVDAVGLRDGGTPLATFPEMAQVYVAHLLADHPSDEYVLSGYCAGGLIACEMAHLLEEWGRRVAALCLINTSAPDPEDDIGDEREAMFWITRSVPDLDLGMAMRALSIARTCSTAQHDFTMRAIGVPVLFVQPGKQWQAQDPGSARVAVDAQWDGMRPFLTGPVERVVLDNGPNRMMQEPWVVETAASVRKALDARSEQV